jgi:hypothetical protein
MWFNALKFIFTVAGAIARYMERKQLLDAGEASAIAANLKDANKKLTIALEARRNVSHKAKDIANDSNNRS